MALVPTSVPPAAEVTPGQFEVGFPPRGAAPALFGAQLNGLLGWRGLRDGVRVHQVDEAADDYPGAPSYSDPPPIHVPRGPVSNTLWVALVVVAEEVESGDPPEVEVQLETAGGAAIDGPLLWSFDNGFLPASPRQIDDVTTRAAAEAIEPEQVWQELWLQVDTQADRWITTGWGRGAVLDEPRRFELADVVAPAWAVGDPLYLRVTTTAVRVHSVTWAEAWQPVLPDLGP